MPATSELVAAGRDDREVESLLGADWLIYQDLPDLIEACRKGNTRIDAFDTSCFSGEYVTGVDPAYLEAIEAARSDAVRASRRDGRKMQLAS
jgi:amidophosphoribosyltransferase